jgi:hypothetical protein
MIALLEGSRLLAETIAVRHISWLGDALRIDYPAISAITVPLLAQCRRLE